MPAPAGIFAALPTKILHDVACVLVEHHDPLLAPVKVKEARDISELCTMQQVCSLKGKFGEVARETTVDELVLNEQGQARLFSGLTIARRYDSNSFYCDLIAERRIHTLSVVFTHQMQNLLPKQIAAYLKAVKNVVNQVKLHALDNLSKDQLKTVLQATPPVQKIFIQASSAKKGPEKISAELDRAIHDFLVRTLRNGHPLLCLDMRTYATQTTLREHLIDALGNRRLKEACFFSFHLGKKDLCKIYNTWRTNNVEHLVNGKITGRPQPKEHKELVEALESFGAPAHGKTRNVELSHPFSKVGHPCTIFFYLNVGLCIHFRVEEAPRPSWLNPGVK